MTQSSRARRSSGLAARLSPPDAMTMNWLVIVAVAGAAAAVLWPPGAPAPSDEKQVRNDSVWALPRPIVKGAETAQAMREEAAGGRFEWEHQDAGAPRESSQNGPLCIE